MFECHSVCLSGTLKTCVPYQIQQFSEQVEESRLRRESNPGSLAYRKGVLTPRPQRPFGTFQSFKLTAALLTPSSTSTSSSPAPSLPILDLILEHGALRS
jgi:hypothetical protein